MFTLDDFWNIFNFLKNSESLLIDEKVKSVALNERIKSENLFENTIDQIAFSTDDNKRLRNFLIDWYSAHKTLIAIQKNSNDVYSLPAKQISELIKSFGFNCSINELSDETKINLFLDLVNLYKVKGTPYAIKAILGYYGFNNIDLAEYWLRKDESSSLVFRSETIYENGPNIDWPDIDFETITSNDPHWKQSESDVLNLLNNNKIALPSKSPYFGIRPKYDIVAQNVAISFLSNYIQNLYNSYIEGNEATKNINIDILKLKVDPLSLYVACNLLFTTLYSTTNSQSIYIFDTTSSNDTFEDLYSEFTSINTIPTSILEKNSKLIEVNSLLTQNKNNFFLYAKDLSNMLTEMDSDLKSCIDSWISYGKGDDLLSYLLTNFDTWSATIIPGYRFSGFVLGIRSLTELLKIVNFFKPYRSRLITFETAYIIDDKLKDSIVLEDSYSDTIKETTVDFDTASGVPCCESESCEYYSRETYDCGNNYDIGVSDDKEGSNLIINEKIDDILNYYPSDTTSYIFIEYTTDESNIDFILSSSGFPTFDVDGKFDVQNGNDICQITVIDS